MSEPVDTELFSESRVHKFIDYCGLISKKYASNMQTILILNDPSKRNH